MTAEDVESCLYYMHFDSSQDDVVANALQRYHGSDALCHPHGRPLPPTPQERPALPPRPRIPYAQQQSALTPGTQSGTTHLSIRRKPVSLDTQVVPEQSIVVTSPHAQHAADLTPPPLPPRKRSETRSSTLRLARTELLATLVRRDPSSGMQWNVATITDPPMPNVSSSAASDGTSSARKGLPIYLDVYTRGYQKFMPPTPSFDGSDGSLGRATPDSVPSLEYSSTDGSTPALPYVSQVFTRRLWMEGSHFLGSGTRGHRSSEMEHSRNPISVLGASAHYNSTQLDHSTGRTLKAPSDGRVELNGERRSSAKGYTFLSPWQGRCEFATSMLGTSLKCRHRLPGISETVGVSELRFNLPSRPGHRKSSSHYSIAGASLAPPPDFRGRRTRSVSSVDDEYDGADLSLGQELAGGGATGKQAKLGKLIIQHEGLQMLDLIVAANLALWQRAYKHAANSEPS